MGLSQELKSSLSKNFKEKHLVRLYKKIDNYRKSSAFFFKLAAEFQKQMQSDTFRDDLYRFHPLVYYCLKFSAYKLLSICEYLESKQCPSKILFSYDTEYWNEFLSTSYYEELLKNTRQGQDLSHKLFKEFRQKKMPSFLQAQERSLDELKTLYNDDITADCSASLEGKLMEAISTLNKILNKREDRDLKKLANDVEFAKYIKEGMDDSKILFSFEQYYEDKEKKECLNFADYVKDILSIK